MSRTSSTGFDLAALKRVFDDSASGALAAFRDRPALLGSALLAYTFGLRHAVDADHISAIDNVTRRARGYDEIEVERSA